MLKKRTLGSTGLEVSEIALGGLFISSYGSERATAKEVIRRASELGINYIDTAPGYADSESVLGEALSELDVEFYISTKVGYKPEPYKPKDLDFIRDAIDTSLANLKRDAVDILMIHEPDRWDDPNMIDWWDDTDTYQGPVMQALNEAKESGKANFLGLGGTTAYEMPRVMNTGNFSVVLTAFQYDLLWREAEHEVLPMAEKQNMGIVCGSPLHQGNLAKMYENDIATNPIRELSQPRRAQFIKLYELAKDMKMSMPELGLRFILSNPKVSTVLTGVKNIAELESSVAAAEKGPLPEDVLKALDDIADMVRFRPYLEPLALPFKS
jgi:aryl-alcohol dehydrogenase-like predicted oxidoreductase